MNFIVGALRNLDASLYEMLLVAVSNFSKLVIEVISVKLILD